MGRTACAEPQCLYKGALYGLDGPGIESWWGRDFPHLSRPALGPTQPPVQWVPGLSRGVKSGRGMILTPHPHLVPWSRKGRAIPLLPPWAVWPVQSLSACTRVHFTGWTVQGSNPGGGEIFCTCPDRPLGPPSLLYNGYWVFPGGKERPGRDADPSPPVIVLRFQWTVVRSTSWSSSRRRMDLLDCLATVMKGL